MSGMEEGVHVWLLAYGLCDVTTTTIDTLSFSKRSEQLRLCPGCQIYIEPRGGCPKMTCVCSCKFCVICGWVKDDGRGRVAPEKTCACKSGKSHAFPLRPESDRGPAPRLARFEEEQALAYACKRVRDGEVVPRTTRSGKRARSD